MAALVSGPPVSNWLEAGELQAVGVLQAGLAERPGRALGRAAEGQRPVAAGVGELGERGHASASSANALVTAKAFWSVAFDGVPKTRPLLAAASGLSGGERRLSASLVATGVAFGPLTVLLMTR